MGNILDLSNANTDRYIIVGDVRGDHDRLVSLLYQQKFSYKDTLILVGNFLAPEAANYTASDARGSGMASTLTFVKNVMNGYSVKGNNESDLVQKIASTKTVPTWLSANPKYAEILNFIDELPLIIKVSPYIYILNAGLVPNRPIDKQDPEVFYKIGSYDRDSRFYQFDNPEEKSWYDFEFFDGDNPVKYCFGGEDIGKITVPAGFCLGRGQDKPLRALIVRKGKEDSPIIIEM